MPFSFVPLGLLTGALVLGGSFVLLYLIVTRLDRALAEVGGVVGGLVTGFDDWSHGQRDDRPVAGPSSVATGVTEPDAAYETAIPAPVEATRVLRRP